MATTKKSTKKTAKKTPRKKASRRGKAPPLTKREHAIVKRMTAAGKTMRAISAKIGRAPSTIWRHQQMD